MFNSATSLWLGLTFVVIGAINVWLVLQASARVKDAKANTRLIVAHRIGGYLFIALYCVMGYFMLARLRDAAASAPPSTMIHLTLAIVLSPLLFVKVLVARYYKTYYSLLMPIGLMIFVLSFALIGITAGPSLAHRSRVQSISLEAIDLPLTRIDINMAAATMERRCSKCHNLDRIVGARKDARGWLATVNRMRALPGSGISEEDFRIIVSYFASQMAPKGSVAASLDVERALVDQRCGRCHSLDRVYKTVQTPEDASDPFHGVPYWAKVLKKHAPPHARKFLVSARCDVSPVTVDRREINRTLAECSLDEWFKTARSPSTRPATGSTDARVASRIA